MKKIVLVFILCISFTILNAQTVLTVGNRNISLEEFKEIFYKNQHDKEVTKEYLEDYMNLFVNYKLKVIEAEELGLDTNQSFIEELEGYRKQLAKPYLKNNEFDTRMIEESYNRMLKDVRASHILLSLELDATKEQEDLIYSRALELRENIINGKMSFSEAAQLHSDDKSALSNGGDLGYFTVFMMVYEFESAAYNTEIGDISMPVRTKYGYHLIQVNDKRDAVGKVKVAHIMLKTGQDAPQSKIDQVYSKISQIHNNLISNIQEVEFSDIAERFSEDRSTAVKGGVLPIFGVGKMVPEFEKVAFTLEKAGDISEPFLTDYGWHIIKLIEKNPVAEFSKIESDLKRMVERDSRGELSEQALYEKLHAIYKVRHRPDIYSAFRKKTFFKILEGIFSISPIANQTLFSIDEYSISVNDFSEYILSYQSEGSDIDKMYIDFVNAQLLLYEDSQLENKYPKYKSLLREYREGILLFDLTNKKVWTKAVEDTVGLETFFTVNRASYIWPTRVDATIYTCVDLETARQVKTNIYKKNRGCITDEEMLNKINVNSAFNLDINSKRFQLGDNQYIDGLHSIGWKTGIAQDIVLDDKSYVLIDIHAVIPEGLKELHETRGKVISDYQDYLDKNWIDELKMKYSVEIKFDVLHSLIK